MDLSLFLARSWGLFLALICAGILMHRKKFIALLLRADVSATFLVGILLIGVGVVQVVAYEQWQLSWQGVLTLFGWGSLLKGIFIIFVPGYSDKFIKLAVKEHLYNASLIIGLIVGLYLLSVGYLFH